MEKIRSAVRKIITPSSPVFVFAANVYNDLEVTRREGFGTRRALKRLSAQKGGAPEKLALSSLAHPIAVRPGTNDIVTVLNNVIREEYAFALPGGWQPRTMIDAGAFIGDTAVYFLSRYPSLSILALEPEASNFDLARENLAPYGDRVRLEQRALSGTDGSVRFAGDSVSGSVQEDGVEVLAASVSTLIAEAGLETLDLLKMDIEGAELDVFRANPGQWLTKVDMIIAELHGLAISSEVCAILADHGFKAIKYRSLTFFRRPDGKQFR